MHRWLELATGKLHQWEERFGHANEHYGPIPRDWWLEDWEKQAVFDYHDRQPLDGYPQSNGELERSHASLKQECIRSTCPSSIDEARTQVQSYVDHYNHVRLHSAIGYLTPADQPNGLGPLILEEGDHKLEAARTRRQQNRAAAQTVA